MRPSSLALLLALLLLWACGGDAFRGPAADSTGGQAGEGGQAGQGGDGSLGGSGGQSGDDSQGGSGDQGGSAGEGGEGQAGDGAQAGQGGAEQGGAGQGGAGKGGAEQGGAGQAGAGQAGAGGGDPCQGIEGGFVYGGHCYASPVETAMTRPQASEYCHNLGVSAGKAGYLVVLNGAKEQDAVIAKFLAPVANKHDAWLGITCPLKVAFTDCYCLGGCKTTPLQAEVSARWALDDQRKMNFLGWFSGDPNGGGRCAAITAINGPWAWGDRACTDAVFVKSEAVKHSYIAICEFE